MKHTFLYIITFQLLTTGTIEAKDYRGRLDVSVTITDMYVAQNEDVYIVNRIGDAYKVNVSDSVWRRCFPKTENKSQNPI